MEIKPYLNEIVIVLSAILVILLYPVILLVIIVALMYRYVVQAVVKRDPKAGNILSGFDACMAGNDTCQKPVSVLIPFYIYNSTIDKYEVMRLFTEKILKPKDNGGKCVYPEMTQKIVRKYGYNFWFQDENFRIENHIKYIPEEDPDASMTREEINDLVSENLSRSSFDPSRSPWEILIVRNFRDSEVPDGKSAMIYKFHHCLFDGYSIANFMKTVAVNPWNELGGVPKLPKISSWKRIWSFLILILSGPYHLIKHIGFTSDTHESMKPSSQNLKGQMRFHETKLIPLQTCKNIRNNFDVGLTSVLFTIVAEGLRQTMAKQQIMTMSKFHICTTFFLPGRPDRLTNHWSTAKIPISFDQGDLGKTLQSVDTEYCKLQYSMSPLPFWYFTKFCGLLPICFHPNPNDVSASTLLVSNFPGPVQSVDTFGYEMIHFGMGGKPAPGYQFFVVLHSYKGYFRFIVGGDASILPEKKDVLAITDSLEEIVSRWEFEIGKSKDNMA